MRFTDYQFTPGRYRLAYLEYLDQIAPEVRESLKTLCPPYELAHSGYAYLDDQFGYMFEEKRNKTADDERYVRLVVSEWYNLVSPEFRSTQDAEITINAILDLVHRFQEFIDTYCLDTQWLRYGLFRLLGRVTYEPTRYDHLWFALQSYGWSIAGGQPVNFHFDGWSIEDSSEKFKSKIRKHFDRFLDEYIEETASKFQKQGYKRKRKLDLSSVKWLVYWNVKRISKNDILQMITDADPSGNRAITVKTLNAHFRKFRNKYELPLRGR